MIHLLLRFRKCLHLRLPKLDEEGEKKRGKPLRFLQKSGQNFYNNRKKFQKNVYLKKTVKIGT